VVRDRAGWPDPTVQLPREVKINCVSEPAVALKEAMAVEDRVNLLVLIPVMVGVRSEVEVSARMLAVRAVLVQGEGMHGRDATTRVSTARMAPG
jgi:hypothetical protein